MESKNEDISGHKDLWKVEKIYEKKSSFLNPALVKFQNGKIKKKRRHPKVNVVLKPTDKGTSVEVKTSVRRVFRESVFSETSDQNLVIAIKNNKSVKIRLVEVDNVLLTNSSKKRNPVVDTTVPVYDQAIKTLYTKFGGKKAANLVMIQEKLNITPIADMVKQTLADKTFENEMSLSESEEKSISDLLPPCHRDSKLVSEVYQIREILSETELDALIQEVKVLDETKLNKREYSNFFKDCYAKVMDCYVQNYAVSNAEENLKIGLAGILFANMLINFLKIPSRNLMIKGNYMWTLPTAIRAKLINEFCIKADLVINRPQTMRDKSICYIIAICLICCDYRINLKLLQAAINSVHMNRLARLAKLVGGVPASKEEYLYILKLPLPSLPKSQNGKPKRN